MTSTSVLILKSSVCDLTVEEQPNLDTTLLPPIPVTNFLADCLNVRNLNFRVTESEMNELCEQLSSRIRILPFIFSLRIDDHSWRNDDLFC